MEMVAYHYRQKSLTNKELTEVYKEYKKNPSGSIKQSQALDKIVEHFFTRIHVIVNGIHIKHISHEDLFANAMVLLMDILGKTKIDEDLLNDTNDNNKTKQVASILGNRINLLAKRLRSPEPLTSGDEHGITMTVPNDRVKRYLQAVKDYKYKYKEEPDINQLDVRQELAELMGESSLYHMVNGVKTDQILELVPIIKSKERSFSDIVSPTDKGEKAVSLGDTISDSKPLPNEVTENEELMNAIYHAIKIRVRDDEGFPTEKEAVLFIDLTQKASTNDIAEIISNPNTMRDIAEEYGVKFYSDKLIDAYKNLSDQERIKRINRIRLIKNNIMPGLQKEISRQMAASIKKMIKSAVALCMRLSKRATNPEILIAEIVKTKRK